MHSSGIKNRDSILNVILFFTDAICIFLTYYLSGILWLDKYKHMGMAVVKMKLSDNLITIVIAVLITALFAANNAQDYIIRGTYVELKAVIRKAFIFGSIVAVYELIRKTSDMPRGVYVLTVIGGAILMYITRNILKLYLKSRSRSTMHTTNVIVITMKNNY